MKIVDFHSHIFPNELAPRAIAALEKAANEQAQLDGTVGGLLASMKKHGIDYSVIQPVATRPEQVKGINNWMSTLLSPLIGFGSLHPEQVPGEIKSEARRLKFLGIKGFKLHPEYQNFYPDEPLVCPIYEAARENNLIVFFHAGRDLAYQNVHGTPEHFSGLLKKFPGLKIVLGHLGSFQMWDEVEKHLVGKNVYFDTSYTIKHIAPEQFKRIVKNHGIEKILFGTDSPWEDQGTEIANLKKMGFSDDELEQIFWKNPAGLLGLDGL